MNKVKEKAEDLRGTSNFNFQVRMRSTQFVFPCTQRRMSSKTEFPFVKKKKMCVLERERERELSGNLLVLFTIKFTWSK